MKTLVQTKAKKEFVEETVENLIDDLNRAVDRLSNYCTFTKDIESLNKLVRIGDIIEELQK